MLTEIDLDSTVSEKLVSSADRRRAREAASRRQNYEENNFEEEDDPLLPSSDRSVTSTGTTSKHKYKQHQKTATIRGRPTYNFSITSKRPRRNVHKRNWADSAYSRGRLDDIEEEESSRDSSTNKPDVHRAPRIAFALLILVCCAGGYRGINDYISRKKGVISIEHFSDLKYAFRGSSSNGDADDNNREALSTKDDINNTTKTEQHIEEIPNVDETIQLPDQLTNLVNIFSEPYNPQLNKLFLWHIPRSGSTTITRIASYCLGLTIASQQGKSEVASMAGSENEKDGTTTVINELRINEGPDGVKFANVDMSNPQGIEHAKTLNVGSSPSIDLISSAYLWDLASIFDAQHQGYMIAMVRHPIERAVSLYYSMKNNKQYEEQVGSLSSVEQYAKSSLVENNWMTRFLSNTLSGELAPEHVAIAKEVLRTKCLIGLLRDKTETMRRLDVFFNLRAIEHTQRREECQEKLLYWDWPNKNRHDLIEKGSTAWDELYKHNMYDMQVYEYAEELFEAQKKLFQAILSSW